MGEGGIMKRVISMIARAAGKHNTEFGAEGGPTLGKGAGRQAGSNDGGSPGTVTGDVYSKQEKIQEE